ncbi:MULTISPECIES: GGDEF domain-containing protein [unclassified Rhizobium]|uniref:GGDEF domain-containing protein n=1 Tax=Rhizobium sp. PP-CC-3G-465 TaxID=2135648 RepID=UPI001045A813|nr:diguanylate cyclase (GGDEF)-like protein [Rhizobium sp. PP-CC-2G-626]TCQ27450.1 diguanylate cyclase (GGDEF)-like protein [Rhizobium sp. PP-CC-3G-465]
MVDVQTLLVSSVTARAGFLLVFLLYSFRPGATNAYRFWTLSILCSALGIWLTYQDAGYPNFSAEKGALVYFVVGLSIVSVEAGAKSFFDLPLDRVKFVATWIAPGLTYWTSASIGLSPSYVLALTMSTLVYILITASSSFLKGRRQKRLPSQILISSSLAFYAVALVGTILSLIVGHFFGYEGLGPSSRNIYLSVFIDQTVSVLIYVGLVAMTLEEAQRQMQIAATTDPLTGLANRRGLQERALAIIGVGQRLQRPMAVLIADIDHFKSINDRYGHAYGDRVLQQFAERLPVVVKRQQDVLARWGGEEFVAVLHGASLEDATHLAELLCRTIEERPFDVDGTKVTVTTSIGVAPFGGEEPLLEQAIHIADAALYKAKRTGRNRVCVSTAMQDLVAEAAG